MTGQSDLAGQTDVTGLRDQFRAGFTDVTITLTHAVADEMHTAIVSATKPRREDSRTVMISAQSAAACVRDLP